MGTCSKKSCIFYYLTILANLGLIIFTFGLYSQSYGSNAVLIFLLLIPPVLSILALRKRGDKEERELKVRIRKASLRKELDDLKAFDKAD